MQSRSKSNLAGIDISHYQPNINYDGVVASGVKVAFIKATEGSAGSTRRDALFATHNTQLRKRGIKTGAYHFAHFYRGSTIDAQVQNFLEYIKGQTLDCAIALDCEGASYHDNLSSADVTKQALSWASKVKAATGAEVIIYANTAFISEHFTKDIASLRLWIADYRNTNAPGENGIVSTWVGFQYTSVKNIRGMKVDGDEFVPSIVLSKAFCYGRTPAAQPSAPAKPAAPSAQKYNVVVELQGFVTAADAMAGKNAKAKVEPGSYFVFNQSGGAVNVTTKQGTPGSWINPGKNVKAAAQAPAKPAASSDAKYNVVVALSGYVTADDAIAGKNAKTTVKPGAYFVFNTKGAAVNITSQKGTPGSWINTGHNVKVLTPTPATHKITRVYTVVAGDTVSGLAERFGTTSAQIVADNKIKDPNKIWVGQRLKI